MARDAAYYREYRARNAERLRAQWAARYTKRGNWLKDYRNKNKAAHAAQEGRRRAAKTRAIPAWADLAEIATIYEAARLVGMEVDHIVPLRSAKVCGLHCPANLRIIPKAENRSKGNRYWPDMFEKD